ncbi:MAG: hypothetical protein ACXABY_17795 [Candidatus Thorarchaeota archaeon]|jgi:hypothetical protein
MTENKKCKNPDCVDGYIPHAYNSAGVIVKKPCPDCQSDKLKILTSKDFYPCNPKYVDMVLGSKLDKPSELLKQCLKELRDFNAPIKPVDEKIVKVIDIIDQQEKRIAEIETALHRAEELRRERK